MEIGIGLVVGLCVGAAVVYMVLGSSLNKARQDLAVLESQREAEARSSAEKLQLLEQARAQLQDSFKALSAEALSKNNADFLNLAKSTLEKYQEGARGDLEKRQQAINQTVEPVGEALKVFNQRVNQIEERRSATDATLKERLEELSKAQVQLSQTTGSLVQALRAPQVRGQWGEMQLRRTVELAGMIDRVDFVEQASVETEAGQRQRPDMIIRLPNETIFSAALEQDPSLIELGVQNKVILATPTTLIALLKAVAYGWQQEAITREAKAIAALGRELYDRIGVVTGHFSKLGKSLDQTVGHYNKAISSVESRLMSTARKLEAKQSISGKEIPEPGAIEKQPSLPKDSDA